MISYVDTHFHLDLWPSPASMVEAIEASRVHTIAVTNAPSMFDFTVTLTDTKQFVRPAIGLHPELVHEREGELSKFLDALAFTRFVGEIGLDYKSGIRSDPVAQRKTLAKILQTCADYGNKILTVHSRGSATDVISAIGGKYPARVILHWFSGTPRDFDKAVEFGFFFSVNYAMASSQKGQRIVSKIPLDRLLTETDGPFVKIGDSACNPLVVPKIIEKVAPLLSIDTTRLAEIILSNFEGLITEQLRHPINN